MPRGGRAGMFNATLTGDWDKLQGALWDIGARFPAAMQDSLAEEGEFYRRKIVEGIREQAPGGKTFKPLSPVTLAIRKLMGFGGTKALIRTGELRNNIVSVAQQDRVFVGILYTARGSDGRSLADLGKLNEEGGIIRSAISRRRMRLIAQAMRKAGLKGSGGSGGAHPGLGFVKIPARPFLRPVFEMYGGQRGANRFMARVARKMGGLLGVITHPDLKGRDASTIPEKLAGRSTGRALKQVRTGSQRSRRARGTPRMARQRRVKSVRPRVRAAKAQKVARQKTHGGSRRQYSAHVKAFKQHQRVTKKANRKAARANARATGASAKSFSAGIKRQQAASRKAVRAQRSASRKALRTSQRKIRSSAKKALGRQFKADVKSGKVSRYNHPKKPPRQGPKKPPKFGPKKPPKFGPKKPPPLKVPKKAKVSKHPRKPRKMKV
jgi:hypothetical protein